MSILWQYLDKKGAAISALKDYSSMQHIIDHTNEEIDNVRGKMESIQSPGYDGMPKSYNPQSGEDRIINAIEEIDVMKERYRQALEYMEWFKPAWDALTDDERYVLEAFYTGDEDFGSGAVYTICDHFGIERSSAYNKKNRAIQHLALLLYGK